MLKSRYRPHPKDEEGNVFSLRVCPTEVRGGEGLWCQVLSGRVPLVSDPRFFLGGEV